MTGVAYHYVFDAVPLLDECLERLQRSIDKDCCGRYDVLHDLKQALVCTERLLHQYLTRILIEERSKLSRFVYYDENSNIETTLATLRQILEEQRREEEVSKLKFPPSNNPQDPLPLAPRRSLYTTRSATDTLLFRLIVALQLCLVRISDAHVVVIGRHGLDLGVPRNDQQQLQQYAMMFGAGCCGLLGMGFVSRCWSKGLGGMTRTGIGEFLPKVGTSWIRTGSYGVFAVYGSRWLQLKWNLLWMTSKLSRSTLDIEEWMKQWHMVQNAAQPRCQLNQPKWRDRNEGTSGCGSSALLDDKSRRLIEYAMQNGPKSYFWQSQGEIRFMMLKRFMDVYYASVGTAIDSTSPKSTWQVPLVAGAAASFYSITGTGASEKATQVANNASRDLIRHAWGMVSLPAIKTLMLQASRLLKGASVADRIEIAGVSCFILSRIPAPELAAALKRQHKSSSNLGQSMSRLSTISENVSEDGPNPRMDADVTQHQFAGSCGRYRQRDVILHCTGGGFFAHTIASDLPYLLDWSAATGAVVVCPEYALLPEHAFPVALEQITDVYSALVDGVDVGFEVNRIIITGESAGGNLAAALCVKLGLQKLEREDLLNDSIDSGVGDDGLSTEMWAEEPTRMPDALMLSCAALNLSLEVSHSRVVGTQDPVLPSGLISAISDAYLPNGFSKQDPLSSPSFAPDSVLEQFPPVLLFAGSNDPLLDDSVAFNERLRCNGVQSELRAAQNMPHAYWGLGTAGFPEAQQVQQECEDWLKRQFTQ